jgi:signal peptide peptidase SppA
MIDRVLDLVGSQPWAILPEKLEAIRLLLARRAAGERLSADDIVARIGGTPMPGPRMTSAAGVAVVPIIGTIAPRANVLTQSSGGTSADILRARVAAAAADSSVRGIVLDIDSPGGNVALIPETWTTIRQARARKPVVAVVNAEAGSAAYWLATAADEVLITPSGAAGGIGIYALHLDRSQQAEREGIRPTFISAGKHKVEGHPFGPLTAEARAAAQRQVDAYYRLFAEAVAEGRRTTPDAVARGFGEGRMLTAAAAVRAGLADRVGTLEDAIARLGGRGPRVMRGSAAPASSWSAAALADDLELRRRRARLAASR